MNDPRGSQWRKWDLHIHTPGTKCNDGYELPQGEDLWEKFCEVIESSDVSVFGLTDYFSFDNYFTFKEKFYERYHESKKIFLPNIELRLNESVNPAQEEVNLHLIFRPDISQDLAQEFLSRLVTEKTNPAGKNLACNELTEFDSATVTRKNIEKAIRETFGEKITRQDHLLIFTAVNNDGIRPERGAKRKAIITDEIDKFSDGFFGGSQNTSYFLNTKRLEEISESIKEKPVVSGSDAHSFDQLNEWLGKSITDSSNTKEVTWIKSDPTFEGLVQILIEPSERVSISPTKPDEKELYKVISKIKFEDTNDFPSEIVFNSNLSTIIGSRSSGKSALLNYIAHAIDREDAESKLPDGPAANKKWEEIPFSYSVEWLDGGENSAGNVIFLPQNFLFNLSSKPGVITERIKPVLFRKFPTIQSLFEATKNSIDSSNKAIADAVERWFNLRGFIEKALTEIENFGNKKAVEQARDTYQRSINDIKSKLSLSDEEVENYQKICGLISEKETLLSSIETNITNLYSQYVDPNKNSIVDFDIDIIFNPSFESLSLEIQKSIEKTINESKTKLLTDVKTVIREYISSLLKIKKTTKEEIIKIREENKELIEKNKKHEELAKLIVDFNKQVAVLTNLGKKEEELKQYKKKQNDELDIITANIQSRKNALNDFQKTLSKLDQTNNSISFGVENMLNLKSHMILSDKYNLREIKDHQHIADGLIDIEKIRNKPLEYLEGISNSLIKLKRDESVGEVSIQTLTFTEEIRFTAMMEGDSIGGFKVSSMTPGKQALFALTLILDESNDAWPLLIDQPEDDLDSRSIYDQIVPYLKAKKKERQIIMVSHNANLAIGADSEQIIVANKHGDDRKNKNSQMFDYYSGAIECTRVKTEKDCVLESCGIREHACDILDGGEEAFEKRKNKYKI